MSDTTIARPAVIVRNGSHLCESCRAKGCDSYVFGKKNDERPYDGPPRACACCEADFDIPGDDFGV